jgi:hypothetical protein
MPGPLVIIDPKYLTSPSKVMPENNVTGFQGWECERGFFLIRGVEVWAT